MLVPRGPTRISTRGIVAVTLTFITIFKKISIDGSGTDPSEI